MSRSRTRWTAAAAAIVVAATPAAVASARDGHDGHGERTKQAAPAPVPVEAQTFVAMATMSNTFEIRSSKIALRRSRDDDVRSIAKHLIADHTAAQANLEAVAGSLGLEVPPPSLDAEQQAVVDKLRKRRGNAFDRAYLKAQVVAHEKAIALFIGTGQNEANPEAIRDLTVATLPILGRHLGEVTAVLDDRGRGGRNR